jgi:hypothetical protein
MCTYLPVVPNVLQCDIESDQNNLMNQVDAALNAIPDRLTDMNIHIDDCEQEQLRYPVLYLSLLVVLRPKAESFSGVEHQTSRWLIRT